MWTKNIKHRLALLTFLVMALPAVAIADINLITFSPSSARAALGQSSSASIRWTLTSDDTPSTVVSSAGGIYRAGNANGPIIGSNARVLSSAGTGTPVVVTITENLLIPSSVIFQAFKLGATRIVYQRTFTDTGNAGPDIADYPIDITSPSAAGFGVSRLALSFEDGAIEKVTEEEQFLRAKADISHTGSGVIRGVWEAADPSSTAGIPIYRTLTQVREFLSAGGEKTLLSPRLPTSSTGLHLVRLRLTDPTLFDTDPVIRYFVQPRPAPLEPIGLVMPTHLSLLGNDTRFAWQPIAGVRAYQLELFEQGLPIELPTDTAPVDEPRAIDPRPGSSISPTTGLLVPGDQTTVPLTALARTRLMSGRTYLWRVLAIGSEGSVIGESPLRVIRVP